jgi:flagellar operon protein
MPQSNNIQAGVGSIRATLPVTPAARGATGAKKGADKGGGFAGSLADAASARRIRFSAHAQERLTGRGIRMDERRLDQLASAADQAQAKGARDSLVLLDDLGLILNVPSRTVVTALDADRMRNGVFTNIDSTVIIRD